MVHLRTCRLISKKVMWSVACLPAMLLLLCAAYLLYLPLRARYLFDRLEELQVGHSSFEDAQRLARKIGAKPYDLTHCDRSYCYWSVNIDNVRLPQWWRGSGATFSVNFGVKGSAVDYKGAWYVIGVPSYDSTPSKVSEEVDPYRLSPPYEVSAGIKEKWINRRLGQGDRIIQEPPTGAGWNVSYFEKNGSRELATARFEARMTPRSSAEDWRRYTAFNYSCLWKYKGCKDGVELLPTAGPIPPEQMYGIGPRQ